MIKLAKLSRNTQGLLKFRILVNSIAFVHLIIMCTKLLNKDFEQSDDVRIQLYAKLKWKLITTWFNLLFFGYIPLSLYCDWQELKEGKINNQETLKETRDFIFTNLILPTTTFADILFWRLWYHDRELMMPLSVDAFVSFWEHHSMHTVSLVFVVLDLVTARRERPKNLVPGLIAMLSFVTLYVSVCVHGVINEEYIYPIFQKFPVHKLSVLGIYTYISHLFYHSGQWLIVDLIPGRTYKKRV